MAQLAAAHVFLSHNAQDKAEVESLARRLLDRGVPPWLDKWEITPGSSWQQALQDALERSAAVLVCVGAHGLGRVQQPEIEAGLERAYRDPARLVLPVLLPGARADLQLPPALQRRPVLDLRRGEPAYRELFALLGKPQPVPAAAVDAESPFRGLAPFEERHARWFFGRELWVARLLGALRERRLLALIGASGSGKSSLLRAGLLPAVRTGELDQSYAWVPLVLRPGPRPLHELALRVSNAVRAPREVSELREGILRDPTLLADELDRECVRGPEELRFLLAIDQFEEVFTLCDDRAARTAFIRALLHAASAPGGRTWIVWTLRADFVSRLLEHPGLAEPLDRSKLLLGPLGPEELCAAIRRPAQSAGLQLEPGLEDLLVQAVAGESADLPLLQFALEELWQQREAGHRLTLSAYRRMGGLRGALARRADAELARLDPAAQGHVRRLFGRLVHLGEGAADTRRRLPADELAASHPELREPLESLIRARLLTAHDSEVEVVHEALIREWPTLRTWIAADRELLRLQHELARSAAQWQRSGDRADLWSGGRLARALELQAAGLLTLSAPEEAFLAACQERAERAICEQRERAARELVVAQQLAAVRTTATRRLRASLVATAVLLVAVGAAARAARDEQRSAESASTAAQQTIENAVSVAEAMVGTVERDLSDLPGASELRRRLLESGENLLRRLAAGVSGASQARLLRNRAAYHIEQSELASGADDLVNARAEAEAALAIWTRLVAIDPSDARARLDRVQCLHQLARVEWGEGRLAQARDRYEEALAFVELVNLPVDEQRRAESYAAISHQQLGAIQDQYGNTADARREYQLSLAVRQRLASQYPGDDRLLHELSTIYLRLADLEHYAGRRVEARAHAERALQINRRRVEQQPNSFGAQRDLSDSHHSMASIAWWSNDASLARSAWLQSLEINRDLLARDPGQTQLRYHISATLTELGSAEAAEGQLVEARRHQEEAIALIEPLEAGQRGGAYLKSALEYAYRSLSETAALEGRVTEASDLLEKSNALNQERIALDSQHAQARNIIIDNYISIGSLAERQARTEAARRAYEAAVAAARQLVKVDSGGASANAALSLSLGNLGNIALAEGKFSEARELHRQALSLDALPASDQRVSMAYDGIHLARILGSEGRFAEALDLHGQAIQMYRQVLAEQPDVQDLQGALAYAHEARAWTAALAGRLEPARRDYEAALQIHKRILQGALSEQVAAQVRWAATLRQLGTQMRKEGQFAELSTWYAEARTLLEKTIAQSPQNASALEELAQIYREAGLAAQGRGRLTEARGLIERALALNQRLAERDAGNLSSRWAAALDQGYLGELAQAEKRPAEAMAAVRSSLNALRALVAEEPSNFQMRRDLHAVYLALAAVQCAAGLVRECRQTLEEALQLAQETHRRSPTSEEARRDLAANWSRLAAAQRLEARNHPT